jgi:hypothetical protein
VTNHQLTLATYQKTTYKKKKIMEGIVMIRYDRVDSNDDYDWVVMMTMIEMLVVKDATINSNMNSKSG